MQREIVSFDPVRLEVYRHLFTALAEEMGAALRRSAYSPNIKERRDYSCALFDGSGRVVAMGDHMPVHLGAMPLSVAAALEELGPLGREDVAALNDPFRGGTHLPDITLIAPVWEREEGPPPLPVPVPLTPDPIPGRGHRGGAEGKGKGTRRGHGQRQGGQGAGGPIAYLAARAHHADVGGMAAGSMPLAREIFQEGLRIPPVRLLVGGERQEDVWRLLLANVRTPEEREGDLAAQLAALSTGRERMLELVRRRGEEEVGSAMAALLDYAARLVRAGIERIPDGVYEAEDTMDDDGVSAEPVPIRVRLEVKGDELAVDFSGTSSQVAGGINAVAAITTSCVRYVVRCVVESVLQQPLPAGGGEMGAVKLVLPARSLVGAGPPASVAGGNVETSQRITDVLLLALARALPDRIPAQSQGTMNNITVGGTDPRDGQPFAYYETVGGGMGGGPAGEGLSGVHVHMTNSLNTPIEALEHAYPFRVRCYRLRRGTGGAGANRGGDGLRRDLELRADAEVSLLTERRRRGPAGLAGGAAGATGENVVIGLEGERILPAKVTFRARTGDIVSIRTPGGGGWGPAAPGGPAP